MEHYTDTARTDENFPEIMATMFETPVQTPTGYDHVTDITRPLTTLINSGHTGYRVFEDWVEMIISSLRGDEDAYETVITKYDDNEIKLFSKAFGEVLVTTQEYDVDVLGDVYESLGINSDHFSQHFTPHSISEGMADMQTYASDPPNFSDERPPTVGDPACGSGRLLVSMSQRMPDGVFFGQDKDKVCAEMTAINFCLFNIDGYVAYGDSLTMDVHRAWQTAGTQQGGIIREVDPSDIKETLVAMFESP